MKRQFILCDPDPTGTAGGTGDPAPTPAPGKKADDKPADTSADVAARGKTAKEIALEKKVAVLEDEQNTMRGQLKTATEWIKKQVEAAPTPTAKESLADEVHSFLGWGLS